MQADIAEKREALAALCRRYGVARLEVFGSAARGTGFDPNRSDADFLVTFTPAVRNNLAAFTDLKDALERLLGRPPFQQSEDQKPRLRSRSAAARPARAPKTRAGD